MNKYALIVGAAAACAPVLTAQAASWTLGQWYLNPANNHYYSVQTITGGTVGWPIARSQAQALSSPSGSAVDLATLTDSAENTFVFDGINDPAYWVIDGAGNNEGPNLGGFQTDKNAEPTGNWAWVTGEPWSYTAWSPGEPNNFNGAEDFLTYFTAGSGRTAAWNDIPGASSPSTAPGVIRFYVAESGIPEPASLSFLACAAAATLGTRRRARI